MDDLELAWETYDFHSAMLKNFELKHEFAMEYYEDFIEKNLNPSQTKKTYVRNKLNKSFASLSSVYVKVLSAIDDLIKIYEDYKLNHIPLPEHRQIDDPRLFFNLKNITATLMEEMKVSRREINGVLR